MQSQPRAAGSGGKNHALAVLGLTGLFYMIKPGGRKMKVVLKELTLAADKGGGRT